MLFDERSEFTVEIGGRGGHAEMLPCRSRFWLFKDFTKRHFQPNRDVLQRINRHVLLPKLNAMKR